MQNNYLVLFLGHKARLWAGDKTPWYAYQHATRLSTRLGPAGADEPHAYQARPFPHGCLGTEHKLVLSPRRRSGEACRDVVDGGLPPLIGSGAIWGGLAGVVTTQGQ